MDVLKTYDDRIGLESGKELVIKDGSGINTYRAVIIRELGRGSNCIVYKGHLDRLVEGRQVKSFVVIKALISGCSHCVPSAQILFLSSS